MQEDALDLLVTASRGARPVAPEARDGILAPFIAAVRAALFEMANTEAAVCGEFLAAPDRPLGDLSVELVLQSNPERTLVLSFPSCTAAALAARILAEAARDPDEYLTRDCMGELANVIAGQAKTLLADTAHHFTFSLPRVVTGTGSEAQPGSPSLIVVFRSDVGEFALKLTPAESE